MSSQTDAARARLQELQAKINRAEDDIDYIERSYGTDPDAMDEGHATRYRNSRHALQRAREEYDQVQDRVTRLEEVLRGARDPGRTEAGDGSYREPNSRRSPGFIRRGANAFDTDLDYVKSAAAVAEPTDIISRAQWAVETAPRHFSDSSREGAMRLLDAGDKQSAQIARHMLLTGSPAYHEQFEQYMATQGRVMGPEIARALSLSPDSAGGALVPFTLDSAIILSNLGIAGSLRSLATIKTIATNDWNGVTSAGVTAGWLAENTAASDNTPSFAQPAITPQKGFAWVVGSYESLADSNFAEQLGMLITDARMRLDEAAFATGSGSGQPMGMVTRAVATTASRVTSVTSAAFAAADVFNISAAASPRHASQSVWFANKSNYLKIRQFSTVTSGGAFWSDMGVGRPSQLLGVGTYESSAMDAYAANTTASLLVLANPKEYYIVDRIGTTMVYVPAVMNTSTPTPTGQAGWISYWRVGGDQIAPDSSARVFRQATNSANWS